jgi:hypothetical protein
MTEGASEMTMASMAGQLDRTAAIRYALTEAPIGAHALVEAAFAWHQLRPAGHVHQTAPGGPALPRHLPVAETSCEEVAVRLARLLSGLAWAVLTDAGADAQRRLSGDSGAPPRREVRRLRVEVPQMMYHRVNRALTGVWRQARRQFDPLGPAGSSIRREPGAAIALWRMGLLIGGPGPNRDIIYLRTGTPAVAGMLRTAAGALGVAAAVEHVRGDPAVVVSRARDVRRLLTETGALEALAARI